MYVHDATGIQTVDLSIDKQPLYYSAITASKYKSKMEQKDSLNGHKKNKRFK